MSIDKQVYQARFDKPDHACKLFPTDPTSRIIAEQTLTAIPMLPYAELYDLHTDKPEVVKSSLYRTLSAHLSPNLELHQNQLFPIHQILRQITGNDPSSPGFLGAIARQKLHFKSFLPWFYPEQTGLIYDYLRQVQEHQRLHQLILNNNLINDHFYHFLTVLELEELALRLPNQLTFLTLLTYIEKLNFSEFDLVANFPTQNQDLLAHIQAFQLNSLPTNKLAQLSLYFRNLAINILPNHDLLINHNFIQTLNSVQAIYIHFEHFVSSEQFHSQFSLFQQQLLHSKKQFFQLLLKLFQLSKFKQFELEIYTQIFEDSYSFVDQNFDSAAFTFFVFCSARYVFLLNQNNRKFSFVYDKILKLINTDRQILIDLEANTSEIDQIYRNLTSFNQQEMMIQTQKNRSQKQFIMLIKQYQMKGINLIDQESINQFEQIVFKSSDQIQIGYSGLLSRVQQRVDLDRFSNNIDVSNLKKFYFNCNRTEGEESGKAVSMFNMLQAMIGTSCLE
ncbi:hypothetical protein SS50377_27514 [Spironucleus salmonicida]|uniref:Uncharacterized protein n=1 Tax=Spironucleus salmonicida TaxID=348837 RepID=V6LRK0_9EUKA|nr:hypothetical protein SS50377_27514 [Spironucleus salmonicida]|eukprot:EST46893.1 Hypothetical protein SS50377_13046 [Spironucleus salmonicida]